MSIPLRVLVCDDELMARKRVLRLLGELGEVLEGRAPGRRNAAQVTLYKSLGIVAQDLYAAAQVLSAARATGAGTAVEFC